MFEFRRCKGLGYRGSRLCLIWGSAGINYRSKCSHWFIYFTRVYSLCIKVTFLGSDDKHISILNIDRIPQVISRHPHIVSLEVSTRHALLKRQSPQPESRLKTSKIRLSCSFQCPQFSAQPVQPVLSSYLH